MNIDQEAIHKFGESLKTLGRQPATVESYCRDARGFLSFLHDTSLDPTTVEPSTLIAYQEHLVATRGEKSNSVRRTVIGIRQFFRFLSDSRAIPESPFDMVAIPDRNDALPVDLKHHDIESLLKVIEQQEVHSLKAARDAAIVGLLAHEGLKANELIALRWSDFIRSSGSTSLHVVGPRSRTLELSVETARLLERYREMYAAFSHPTLERAHEKRAFIAFKGRDAAIPLPMMTRHGLKFILYELGEKAGIAHLNTELLRHYAVSHLLSLGRSPEEVMQHLGLRRAGNIAKHLATRHLQGATAPAPAHD